MHALKKDTDNLKVIKARAHFLKIQNSGKKWVSHGLVVQAKDEGHEHIGIGYTVTKRTDKSAVKRNRIKRRLRAVAAEILPHHAKVGVDYILVGRPLTATRPYEQLKQDLIWCLGKMDLLKDEKNSNANF